uniref:Bromodomain-containing protein 8-like n=2 Tax=Hirondellea gigas TaxID=1518452 RepID=A0A6A7FT94_9CRUS
MVSANIAVASVVQKLFTSSSTNDDSPGDSSVVAQQQQEQQTSGSPALSKLLEEPPSSSAATTSPPRPETLTVPKSKDMNDIKASGEVESTGKKPILSREEERFVAAPDNKASVLAIVNGTTVFKQEILDTPTCGKLERIDTSSMVIKEDLMVIINKPETECQSSQAIDPGASSTSGKEGYQESVSSPTLPKHEIKGVWDDMKGCGEVLQLGEVQRKYSRLGHTSKYQHYGGLSDRHAIKLEKDSDVEDLEEEDDGGFAGFGPSSINIGSRIIGSVIGAGTAVPNELETSSTVEDEDVYNIDNDDTIGLKATKKRKMLEHQQQAIAKLILDSEDSCEPKSADNHHSSGVLAKTEASGVLGTPVQCSTTTSTTISTTSSLNIATCGDTVVPIQDLAVAAAAAAAAAAANCSSGGTSKRDNVKKQFRQTKDKRIEEKSIDFDDCDSVDSLITSRSSVCGGDSDAGGSSSGGSGRGCKRKLHQTSDQLCSSASAVGSPQHFSDASPESPTSTNNGDDPDSEKALRQWRKSIMILWNEIAAHRYASVFLKPITEDRVPGYHSIVHRAMDLQTLKRNTESGALRTTEEFQRDIMLMCTNAIIYNKQGHNVYDMAGNLMRDALAKIEEFQSAAGVVAPESPHKTLRRETRESLAKRTDHSSHRHKKKKKTA